MKRRMTALLLLAVLLLASACEKSAAEGGVSVYFLQNDPEQSGSLLWTTQSLPLNEEMPLEERCQLIVTKLQQPPEGLRSPLPSRVEVNALRVNGNVVYVDLSAAYESCTGYERSTAAAALTLSLLQCGGLKYVYLTCEGQYQPPLYGRYYTADTFVLEDQSHE